MIARRKAVLAVVVASAVLVLTGCASLRPGAAAVVDSATISIDEMLICGAMSRRAVRPSIAGPTKIASSV